MTPVGFASQTEPGECACACVCMSVHRCALCSEAGRPGRGLVFERAVSILCQSLGVRPSFPRALRAQYDS